MRRVGGQSARIGMPSLARIPWTASYLTECLQGTKGSYQEMPRVNPEILIWARVTAGLTQSMAAKKLGFHSSARSSAEEKLTAIENGVKEPSRPQLLKMADQYRRPLITFYLSKPPAVSGRGPDFGTQHKERLLLLGGSAGRFSARHESSTEHGAGGIRRRRGSRSLTLYRFSQNRRRAGTRHGIIAGADSL